MPSFLGRRIAYLHIQVQETVGSGGHVTPPHIPCMEQGGNSKKGFLPLHSARTLVHHVSLWNGGGQRDATLSNTLETDT